MPKHYHYGSTPNFRNLYKTIESRVLWEESKRTGYTLTSLILMPTPQFPILNFSGSEKLHGTNMAVYYTDGNIVVQARNRVVTLGDDQDGMAVFVHNTSGNWRDIFSNIIDTFNINTASHTIIIDAEFAGGNIQKGNAACSGTDKGAYIFDYFRVVNNDTDESQSYSTTGLKVFPDDSIYLMSSFGSYELLLDFNKPEVCEEQLKTMAEVVEATSPIAKYFDKPTNVGEGVYLYSEYNDELLRLKSKGDKHGGKPKKPKADYVAPTTEELKAIDELAEAITPVWRLTQAITETDATEMKHIGLVIKWVMKDIVKEESETIVASGIEFKKAQGTVTKIIKDYYIDSIKGY